MVAQMSDEHKQSLHEFEEAFIQMITTIQTNSNFDDPDNEDAQAIQAQTDREINEVKDELKETVRQSLPNDDA